MKKLFLFFAITLISYKIALPNPIIPESLIIEVYFDDNEWYAVVDVYLMEILDIESFQEISMFSLDGPFVFKEDFLPDFINYQTVITQDALIYPHQLYREEDQIIVLWSGPFFFMTLKWGNTPLDPVRGPDFGESLIVKFVGEDQYFNTEFWLMKSTAPYFQGNYGIYQGTLDGYLYDQDSNPVANAEIRYIPDYLYEPWFFFPHLVTSENGYFYLDNLYARNYTISKIIVGNTEYPTNEFISIEPDEMNTFEFSIDLTTGIPVNADPGRPAVSNYPNPFTGKTTLVIEGTGQLVFSGAHLVISNATGKTVSVLPLNNNSQEDGMIRIPWNADLYLNDGHYFYSLVNDGSVIATGKMTLCK